MRTVAGLFLITLTLAASAGCTHVNYTAADRYDLGLVVCLSGAGGMMGECEHLREGLVSGGVDRAVEIFEWSRGEVLSDQVGVEENRRKAHELSRRLESYEREHPGRPVHLVGVSAGTGLAVWAVEDLSEGSTVTGVILISSSLDTRYDLSKALAKVTDHLYSFGSPVDAVLSLGVTWTGTVDRGGGLAGGFVGFNPPDKAPDDVKALYKEKLVQISWWPGDVILGHAGDHLGATNPLYVKEKIAPLVLGRKPAAPPAEENHRAAENKNGSDKKPAGDPKADDPKKADDTKKAKAPEPSNDHKAQKTSARGRDKNRFVQWNVGAPAAPPRDARPQDDSRFFVDTGRLP